MKELTLQIKFDNIKEMKEFLSKQNNDVIPYLELPNDDKKRKNKPWTDYEIEYIRNNYANFSAKDIAKVLQRTTMGVTARAYQMNLRKNNKTSKVEKKLFTIY